MGHPARKSPSVPEPAGDELDHAGEAAMAPEDWESRWNDELSRRIGQIERGEVELLDGEKVMAEMRARIAS